MHCYAEASTAPGRNALGNGDFYSIDSDLGLFIVADGIDDTFDGAAPAKVAATTVARLVARHRDVISEVERGVRGAYDLECLMRAAVMQAAKEMTRLHGNPWLPHLGCSLTAALTVGDHLVIAHAGNTRAYLRRGGSVTRLTRDHTVAAELEAEGGFAVPNGAINPVAKILTNALGQDDELVVDTSVTELEVGDEIILCSDGVSEWLDDADLRHALDGRTLAEAAADLVVAARRLGRDDSATAVTIAVDLDPPSQRAA